MATIPLVCLECSFKFSAVSLDTCCPRCWSVKLDIDQLAAVLAMMIVGVA